MSLYFSFTPDLIVEATSVCDRACSGCYAPNVVSTQSMHILYTERPDLFLSPHMTAIVLSKFESSLQLISIRGGEPTRHPELAKLISLCGQIAATVVVETHGRWLLPENVASNSELLKAVKTAGATIKLSFDRMHGLRSQQLKIITDFLNENRIRYLVAITELDETQFMNSRRECSWIPNDQIIFQQKTNSNESLSNPPCGVLNVRGQTVKNLNVKKEFGSNRLPLPQEVRRLSI